MFYKTTWGKEIKCEACREFYLFSQRNEFNKFNNTRARMLDSDIKFTLKSHFCLKNVIILSLCNVIMDVITFTENLKTTYGLSILLHGVISLPDATSYDNLILLFLCDDAVRKDNHFCV